MILLVPAGEKGTGVILTVHPIILSNVCVLAVSFILTVLVFIQQ